MGLLGALVGLIWVALFSAALAALGLRLRRRAMRRGQYPHRDLPWYLGGVPDIDVKHPPDAKPRDRRRRR